MRFLLRGRRGVPFVPIPEVFPGVRGPPGRPPAPLPLPLPADPLRPPGVAGRVDRAGCEVRGVGEPCAREEWLRGANDSGPPAAAGVLAPGVCA